MVNLVDFAERDDELEELREANRRLLRKLNTKERKEAELVAAVYQASYDAALALGPAPSVVRPAYDDRHGEEIALLHTTDWQYGKKTESYDMSTAETRLVDQQLQKLALITDIQRHHHPVNKLALLLGGDMVEGVNIFPGQAYELEEYLYEQIFGVARIIEKLVHGATTIFPEVEVWEEEGNHGRLGRTGDWPRKDNSDLIAYRIVREKFANSPAVQWHPRSGFYQPVDLGNYTAILVHGDEIKSFGGNTPAFGILRKANSWASGVIEFPFKDIYMGHFHSHQDLLMANGNMVFMTGSPESDNAYAAEFVAATGHPSQRLHFIDPDAGIVTSEHRLYLD